MPDCWTYRQVPCWPWLVCSVASYKATGSLALAMAVGLAVGVVCNIVNGIIVTRFNAPPFIATLAMQTVARGAALQYTSGQNIYQIGNYVVFGQSSVGPIPTPVLFMVGIGVVTWYLLRHTRLGRSLYAIGGNAEAARASGINVNAVKMKAYLINGVFVGIAGVLFMSRVNAGLPNAGIMAEFEAMTSAIIGGTSFSGGIGTASGTLAGAFIMGILNNIMNLMRVQSYMQQIVRGAIIALAVCYDIYSKKKRKHASSAPGSKASFSLARLEIKNTQKEGMYDEEVDRCCPCVLGVLFLSDSCRGSCRSTGESVSDCVHCTGSGRFLCRLAGQCHSR